MKRPKEKTERALNTKLFIKADRCSSPKCALIRKPYRPGMHGQKRRRGKLSEYGKQLQEKQKLQIVYGLTNRQLRILFRDNDAEHALIQLEKRADRVVFLMGFAKSPRIARQLISHGHILINGRKTTVPSRTIKKGDIVEIKEASKKRKPFEELDTHLKQYTPPTWLKVDAIHKKGECLKEPEIDTAALPFDPSLIGEFYAR